MRQAELFVDIRQQQRDAVRQWEKRQWLHSRGYLLSPALDKDRQTAKVLFPKPQEAAHAH